MRTSQVQVLAPMPLHQIVDPMWEVRRPGNEVGLKNNAMEHRFNNNEPGDDWIQNFVKHNKMSDRSASNIKRSRASVDDVVINEFF